MDIVNALSGVGASVLIARQAAGVEEIIGEDGLPYCKTCGEPLLLELKIHGPMVELLGEKRYVPRNCTCMLDNIAREALIEEKKKRNEEIKRQRRENMKSEKYRNSTFDKDDGRNGELRKICEKYVANYKDMIANNIGLGFLGGNGGGKTFWASCIANALIEAGSTVYMSTLTRIIQEMNANYGENRDAIERKIRNVDFLILDDYGAERGTEYSLEQAFEVIDTRYNAGKPLIITANLTEDTLNNPPSMAYGRSYSRVIEMCPMLIRVESKRREQIAAEKRKLLAYLMRGE